MYPNDKITVELIKTDPLVPDSNSVSTYFECLRLTDAVIKMEDLSVVLINNNYTYL